MPVNASTSVQLFWHNSAVDRHFKAGVSLHSHTQFSEEGLGVIADYVRRVPLLRRSLGANVDYERAFYTPALTPRQAYRLEEKQIQKRFQLPAMVSLTDHDKIDANKMLQLMERFRFSPISTEWSVPFGPSFFHIGVHNIAVTRAEEMMRRMHAFTAQPRREDLGDVLADLTEDPDVLVVLNHPLWDEKGIGEGGHRNLLMAFLAEHGHYIHALEGNGLRRFSENEEVLDIGSDMNMPVVAGGDRHGREPNAILNLTRATTFAGFVNEVRHERRSHVVFMPQYQTARAIRISRILVDALREYPEHVHTRKTWRDRIFYRASEATEPVPLCSMLPNHRIPALFQMVEIAVRFAHTGAMRYAFRMAVPASARS